MIVYGYNTSTLDSHEEGHINCPACETKGKFSFARFGKYAHIFWIPFFPLGTKGVAQCQSCDTVFEHKEMPDTIKEKYERFKGTTKTPIWHFSGLGLVAVLVGIGMFSSYQNQEAMKTRVARPMVDDVVQYKTEAGNYTSFRILEVADDNLFIFHNEYEVDRKSGLDEIDIAKNYGTDTFLLEKTGLEEMMKSGDIVDIGRYQ